MTSLMPYVINEENVFDAILYVQDSDEQSANLMKDIWRKLTKDFSMSDSQREAINRLQAVVSKYKQLDPADLRNRVFKAANALNIKLPSSMFSSLKEELKMTRKELIKLANEKPKLRKKLVPLIKEAGQADIQSLWDKVDFAGRQLKGGFYEDAIKALQSVVSFHDKIKDQIMYDNSDLIERIQYTIKLLREHFGVIKTEVKFALPTLKKLEDSLMEESND